MTKAYRIVDWKPLFEVTSQGKPANANTPIENLRKSALPYLRKRVKGHSLDPTDRKMNKMAWGIGIMMEPACRGIYDKLADLAGAQDDPKYRGWVLDEKQRPINAPQIAELLDWRDDGTFRKLLDILCDEEINQVELVEFPHAHGRAGERRGEKGRGEEIGGERGTVEEPFKNETEAVLHTEEINETERDSPGRPDEGGRAVTAAPASALVSGTVSDIPASVSDSAPRQGLRSIEEIKKESAIIILKIGEKIRSRNQSDRTTLNDIFIQLRNREIYETDELLFEMALKKANECWRADFPIKMFVAAMKKSPFCYVPVRRTIIRGSTDKYRR